MTVSLRELWCAQYPYHGDAAEDRVVRGGSSQSPSPISDAELVARIRAGDESAFDTMFRAEFPRIVGFVAALLGSRDSAQDVAAEIFARIWQQRSVWDPKSSVKAYLFRAARNQASNVRRGERRAAEFHKKVSEWAPEPPVVTDIPGHDQEIVARLWQTVDALSPQRRSIAYLRWREGMDYAEIADITGQSIPAVKMQVSRTLSALRAVIPGLRV